MKIALNKCFGGFAVSDLVYEELGLEWDGFGLLCNGHFGIESDHHLEFRAHQDLLAAIEKVGENKASGPCAKVRVIEIPDGVEWELYDYDGIETVHEVHRWW